MGWLRLPNHWDALRFDDDPFIPAIPFAATGAAHVSLYFSTEIIRVVTIFYISS